MMDQFIQFQSMKDFALLDQKINYFEFGF